MDNSVTINLEHEAAEMLITAIKRVLNYDDDNNFLVTDEYNALDALRDVLVIKSGGYNEPSD